MSGDKAAREVMARLAGAWRVVRLVDAGQVVPREEGDDHFLWFTPDVIVTGDQWAAWHMPYVIRADCAPMELDVTRDDLEPSWVQKSIVEVKGDTLRICGAGTARRRRPAKFTSTASNKQLLYVAERCDEPLPR
jgi:uncharacterized protein (TIGR03067 family)